MGIQFPPIAFLYLLYLFIYVIYILYIFINIENRKKLHVHPDKPVS